MTKKPDTENRLRHHLKALRFSDEEMELFNRVQGDRGITDTVVAGLRCLEASDELSNEFLIDQLTQRLNNGASSNSSTG